ncbi:fructose-bisphosphate aldolase class I [Gammaproteobacteria bacterium]|nr:fructose-bisphosphate aldolase class I [Gammaproteobacteria bacterium]MDA7844608.1 fructose-bisphosphate aldolase class I [Gammaproteobacteria bacterium]MDA9102468.1 fructose-bisphosphate aldolase class I [Gammaproteobacteria bacterium]MDB4159050.1 fructose-bisphosphate aldolase class I [Gammaproteobacteria bacterium]
MSLNTLEEIASYIVSDGKGILAADESNPTCTKRFDTIGVESTEESRRDYREMLFRSGGIQGNIGGVILFDETIRQNAKDGTSLVDLMNSQGALPGIKVDKGLQPIGDSDETVTVGLDGLDERLKEYSLLGAKFTKWRAVIKIGNNLPTDNCIDANMKALADYAKVVQDNGMVPMVEPEVLMEGDHSIEECFSATERSLKSLFHHLKENGVNIKGAILKPNMVTSGSTCSNQASIDEVAQQTLECLKANVPSELPAITFLSGGQSELLATAHLDAMNKIGGFDWKLSFSYGRALQAPTLKAWMGKPENIFIAQDALSHRAKMNQLAALGQWDKGLED